tara:strand:- start:1797 stop:2129 length:333 start_codon:yes stop_codon:yes gene_type:complete
MKETSLFIDYFGDSPRTRVLDYLVTWSGVDISKTDLANNAKVGRATLYRIWDDLEKNKIIVHTRKIGKAKLYKLNTENEVIKKLIEIEQTLILNDLRKRSRAQKKVKVSA